MLENARYDDRQAATQAVSIALSLIPSRCRPCFDKPTFDALIATAAKMGVAKGRLVAEIVEDALRRVGALAEPTDRAA